MAINEESLNTLPGGSQHYSRRHSDATVQRTYGMEVLGHASQAFLVAIIPSGAPLVPVVLEGQSRGEERTRKHIHYKERSQGFVLGSCQGHLIPSSLVQLCNSPSTRDRRIGKRQFCLELRTTRLFCGMRWVEFSDPFPSRTRQRVFLIL